MSLEVCPVYGKQETPRSSDSRVWLLPLVPITLLSYELILKQGRRSAKKFSTSAIGAAYGTAKAGIGITGLGIMKPDAVMKVSVPHPRRHGWNYCGVGRDSIFQRVLSYGLVVSVLIIGGMDARKPYSLFAFDQISPLTGWFVSFILHSGFIHLAAGLSCGMTGLAAGHAIGLIGDACARAFLFQSRMFVSMVLMLIFAEVIGLYGLIIALILNTKAFQGNSMCR
ncbi:V-type H+-transporting ATPase 16kDa proteolipid subunit [Puccinia sorghi]|uniref:V-type H+-transporting ATPase 16kDa proteolipid subunit n=1 Tax=Puccinia sorghi TaxID=27349 RepID=A0A0L6VQH6_9BASI|nr:V-type H+-transporting ATPase 16kDa proteolipid subunit [Puccinia sorghi]